MIRHQAERVQKEEVSAGAFDEDSLHIFCRVSSSEMREAAVSADGEEVRLANAIVRRWEPANFSVGGHDYR